MELLFALEEKIKILVLSAKNQKEQLRTIKSENDLLKNEIQELSIENIKLAESNAQLVNRLNTMENSILLESGHVNDLKEERLITRSVLDDLIKSIDSIVENEN